MTEANLVARFREIGRPAHRKEDQRLITGRGCFSDDFRAPDQLHAVVVRSPHAHARIVSIDAKSALAMPGVKLVLTGEDCRKAGMVGIPHNPVPSTKNDIKLRGPGDTDIFIGPHLPLPHDRVRHVGEAVAIVVGETKAAAMDAAEVVAVEYDELAWVSDAVSAIEPGAQLIWDEVPANTPVDTMFGDVAATDAAFAAAAHVVTLDCHIGRVTGVPLEPRAALAVPDRETGRVTLYAGSGGAVRQRKEIAETLGIAPERLRVVSKDVGGNFGTRNRVYVEFPLITHAAMVLQRPVKYTSDRSEAFLSDYQGRDLVSRAQLAIDRDGGFLAMRADNVSNVGARIVSLSPLGKGSALITGNYHIPAATVRARAVFTNTAPTQAYRSSGRPEVTYVIERLIELAARECGFNATDLRRKNLITSSQMPYTNPIGAVYDSGDYARNMDIAMQLADWDGYADRRAAAQARGKLPGRGFCNYVESSTGAPIEQAVITVRPPEGETVGVVELVIGTQPSGQGHETSFAQVAADCLGLESSRISITLGDTDQVAVGGGSHSGRSMRMAGTAIVLASDDLIARGKEIAAVLMAVEVSELAYREGVFAAVDSNMTLDLFEIAQALGRAEVQDRLPAPLRGPPSVTRKNEMHTQVFPNGAQVCEVEIDPETGELSIEKYVAVDDVGRAINPLIVEGQIHGGIVQGVGQVLFEQCVIDQDSGQPLCGSFMDYGMPRADDVPVFETALNEVPSPTNPLGVKAGGEGGTTGALAAVVNAIVDALQPYGVRDLSMPITPFKIWQAIHGAGKHGCKDNS